MSRTAYVQYGCGLAAPPEWTNFDASATLRWERLPLIGKFGTKNAVRFPSNVRSGDIIRGLPVPDGACHGVYASHVLEHLSLNEFHIALDNTRRLLRRGGIFRLIVPDLEWAAREYIRQIDAGSSTANNFFLEATCLGSRNRRRGLRAVIYNMLATSEHGWMWDQFSLAAALEEHGFTRVRPCRYGDCEDSMFSFVEDPLRFENATALEARA